MRTQVEYQTLVKQMDIFYNLSPLHLQKVCQKMGQKKFSEGDYLFHEGEIGEELFIIVEGSVEILRQNKLIATLQKGQVLGEMAPLAGNRRSASAHATGEVTVLFLKQEALHSLLRDVPEFALKLIKTLVNRLADNTSSIEELDGQVVATEEIKKTVPQKGAKPCPNCYEYNSYSTLRCPYCKYSFIGKWMLCIVVSSLGILILLGGITLSQNFTKNAEKVEKTIRKNVTLALVKTIRVQDIALPIESYGRVHPVKTVVIKPQIEGKISEVHPLFRNGNFIKKGDILIKMEAGDRERDVKQAENDIAISKIELESLSQQQKNLEQQLTTSQKVVESLKKTYDKKFRTYQQQGLSELDVYQDERNYLIEKLRLEELQKNHLLIVHQIITQKTQLSNLELSLAKAQTQKERTIIKAPFDGRLSNIQVEISSIISPNTALATLEDLSILEIPTSLPLTNAYKLFDTTRPFSNFMQNKLQIPAIVSMNMNQNHYEWEGLLCRFEAMEENHTIPAIIQIKNSAPFTDKLPLQTGSFVKVMLKGQKTNNVFVISLNWLRENNTIHVVRDNKLHIIPIRIIHRTETEVIVSDGPIDGDAIITSPVPFAVPGMVLQISEIE